MGFNKDMASKSTTDILPRTPFNNITPSQNAEGCTDSNDLTMLDCDEGYPLAINDMDLGGSKSIVPPDAEMEPPSRGNPQEP